MTNANFSSKITAIPDRSFQSQDDYRVSMRGKKSLRFDCFCQPWRSTIDQLAGQPVQLNGSIAYSTDLYDDATVTQIANRFTLMVDRTVEAPDTVLCEMDPMDTCERALLLHEWNDTHQPYPEASTAHRRRRRKRRCLCSSRS